VLTPEQAIETVPEVEPRSVRLASHLGVRDAGRVLRDFTAWLPTQLIPAVAGFLALPLLARRLAPTELGVLTIAQTLVSLGWVVSAQWLTSAVIRELPAHRVDGTLRAFRGGFERGLALTGLAFGAFAVVLLGASVLSSAVADTFWLVLAGSLGLVLQNLATTLYAAELRPRLASVTELIGRTGGIVLGIAFVWQRSGVSSYLLGLALASLAAGIVGLAAAWPRSRDGDAASADVLRWLAYGTPIAINAVLMWGFAFVDRYLLALLKTTGDVGVYSLGYVIGEKSILVPALAFYVAARPLLVTAFEHRGRDEVERLMRAYVRVMLLLTIPVVGYLLVTREQLVNVLATGFYPNYYERADDVIPVVAAGIVVQVIAQIALTGLIVGRRTGRLIRASGAALAANLVANLILIPPFGVMGAAVATAVGAAVFLAAVLVWARPYATMHFPVRTLTSATLATIAAVLAGFALVRASDSDSVDLVVAAIGGMAVYVAALAALGELKRR
jgi:O-antigen/teichoic acid export membrane protein